MAPTMIDEYKTYLENECDIEDYLAKLKDKLSATIREGKKVRIQ